MKFKSDENLPEEVAAWLQSAGHDAMTIRAQGLGGQPDEVVASVCAEEGRSLIALDLDFADLRAHAQAEGLGVVVLRPRNQSKAAVMALLERLLPVLARQAVGDDLWLVDERRLRIRSA